ncbi:MAG: hypothetical protein LBT50_08310 [Prevotellaceae bacterium]|jgi:hypothetical protein|nr:hypothetical protein [Prevotellaceae bacterium]
MEKNSFGMNEKSAKAEWTDKELEQWGKTVNPRKMSTMDLPVYHAWMRMRNRKAELAVEKMSEHQLSYQELVDYHGNEFEIPEQVEELMKQKPVKKDEPDRRVTGKNGRLAENIVNGVAGISRLDVDAEQGRISGGIKNVETTIVVHEIHERLRKRFQKSANNEGKTEKERTKALNFYIGDYEGQELLKYAKKRDWYAEYPDLIEEYEYFPKSSGMESVVFMDIKNKRIIKLTENIMEENLSLFIDNHISLHNSLFPNLRYTLDGFTERDGKINFILSQPLVEGKTFRTIIEKSNDPDIHQKLINELNVYMKENYQLLPDEKNPTAYSNSLYFVGDLHTGNVMKDDSGNFFFIDTMAALNTKDDSDEGTNYYHDFKIIFKQK